MTLDNLLRARDVAALGLEGPAGGRALSVSVTAIAFDSRDVTTGSLFVALQGAHTSGVRFAQDAESRGAVAIVGESDPPPDVRVPWFKARDARSALAALAAAFHRHPSDDLLVLGVTGTNGKTTTTYLLASMFDRANLPCGRLGTVSYRIGDEERPAGRTTPEAPDVQRLLREMVDRGCKACAMEVSSHALALKRVDGTRFAAAVFTNLTRDHLDFHGDMESYFQAKRRLFELLPERALSIINLDDARGAMLASAVSRPVTYAIDSPAEIIPKAIATSLDGQSFEVRTPRGRLHVRSRLVGRPNTYNLLAAVATGVALDLPFSALEEGLSDVASIPGRFQIVSMPPDEVTVVVDYAHTDDALRHALGTARGLGRGRVITVFGCGGDRDRTKRPLMGAVAARLSDLVVLTSDNPRSEDPDRIIEEIKRGIEPQQTGAGFVRPGPRPVGGTPLVLTIADRRCAIERAIREAEAGDLVLIAGKGHENYQEIGDRVLPFDDAQVAREALTGRRRTNSRVP